MSKAVISAVAAIATFLAPKAIEVVTGAVAKGQENKQERDKNWIKVPNVIGADLADAQNAVEKIGLNYLSIQVSSAKIKFKNCKDGMVVKASHKADSAVDPTTTISLYYITQEIIDKSKQLAIEAENKRAQTIKERHDKITGIQSIVKKSLKIK